MRNGTKQLVNRVLSIVDFDRRNGLLYDWDFDSNERYIEEMVYSYDWDFDRRKCLFHVLWKSIEEMVYCTSGISIEHYGLVLWISIEELCRAFFQV